MDKIIAGSVNIESSDAWMKYMPNCFKCLRAAGDDLSVVEIIKLAKKGIDKLNGKITLERQDKTRQDKTRQDKTRQDKTRQDKKQKYGLAA